MKRHGRTLAVALGLGMGALHAQSVDTVLSTELFEPYAVAVDATNNYYIADSSNNRILRFMPDTSARTNFAGVPGRDRGYLDGPGYLARFSNPQGLVAARGGFVVADSGNHRIRFVAVDGTVSTLAGSDSGLADGAGVAAMFNAPAGLAADGAGNIYVADLVNNALRKIDPANAVTTVATNFLRPAAVAVGDNGVLYVADSGNHSIKMVDTNGVVTLFAGSGSSFISGANDALIAVEARFNNPRGLLWLGGADGLLVSDSDNRVLRRVYYNATVSGYSVATVPATVGAGLRLPVGLAKDNNADLLIVDLGANALRRIVSTQTQLPVSDPQIGTVWIVVDPTSGTPSTTLTPVTSSVFNNDVVVAILAENGTETFYTRDGTEPGSANGTSPPPYQNGLPVMPTSILDQTQPNAPADVTLKAISTAAGRRSSAVVTARFQFQVANPAIIGSNPGAVSLECATTNAVLYYTTDGSEPSADSFVYTFGTRLNIVNGTNDVVLKVRGFKNGYAASRLVAQTFVYNNLQTSSIGIPRDFVAGVGSTLVVPVDVRLNADDVLQSLQFRVEITPSAGAPLISDQLRVLPIDPAVDFLPITPPSTNAPATFVYTNTSASGLLIGYFGTNSALYVAANATVAMLAVPIPTTATEGQTYTMSVLYPSATSDGLETPIVLAALANRTITVSNLSYTVGDTAQSTFYNAGDFGNGNLNNNDVNNAFYAAIGIRVPYSFSDIFDAMDAYPSDTVSAVGGNGLITFLDWQAILFRSLRYDTNNWKRSRSAGGLRVVASSTLSSAPLLPAESVSASADGGSLWSPNATITGGVLEQAQPGQSVSVPVMIKVQAGAEVSGLNFLALVVPDINSSAAAVLERPRFVPASGIPAPSLSASLPGGVGCGWMLSSFRPALVGQRLLGHVEFTVPATAQPGQAYLVRFRGVDGSTVKLDGSWANYLFDSVPGVVWVQSGMLRPPTAISDQWKERFFGKVSNVLADAFADPDGDGKNNLEEFLAGTHPASLRFHALTDEWRANLNQFKLKWFGAAGKRYVIESTADPVNGPWEPVTQFVLGEGNLIEVGAPKLDLKALFYRVREFTP